VVPKLAEPGTDVMIFKNFRRKIWLKIWRFLTQNTVKLFKNWIITLVFKKNANLLGEIGEKSPKIVITTGAPRSRAPINIDACCSGTPT
jgi:hypothetical protein